MPAGPTGGGATLNQGITSSVSEMLDESSAFLPQDSVWDNVY